MKVPAPKGRSHWDGEEEVYTLVQYARVSRKEKRRYGLWKVAKMLHLVPERFGCDCYHCQQDWDCCGRLYPATARVRDTRRGVRVELVHYRNI